MPIKESEIFKDFLMAIHKNDIFILNIILEVFNSILLHWIKYIFEFRDTFIGVFV